jgi:hypothetical protein
MFTRHAETRLQQRAIPLRAIDVLMAYGEYHHRRGAEVCYLTKRSRARIIQDLGKQAFSKIEKALSAYLVIGHDGTVITVGHRLHRFKF